MSTYDDTATCAEQQPRPPRRTGRHPVNTGHLVMGVAFCGLVVVWALLTSDTVQLENARWILPLPWLVGGAVGVIASLLRGRRYDEHDGWHDGWHDDKQMRGWQ